MINGYCWVKVSSSRKCEQRKRGINNMYGYRAPLSMKNQDTWDVSQKHSGFSVIILGIVNGVFLLWSIIHQWLLIGVKNDFY